MSKRKDLVLLFVQYRMGSWAEVARRLGVTRAAVQKWHQVPIRHLQAVSEMTGIPRQNLRPDLYE